MRPEDLDYALPPELIAQRPARERSESRMLRVDRRREPGVDLDECRVRDLPAQLRAAYGRDPLVVLNDSKVVPARLYAQSSKGREMELLVTAPSPAQVAGQHCVAWVRGAKRLQAGDTLHSDELVLRYEGPDEIDPRARRFYIERGEVLGALRSRGQLPLPPYIRRPDGPGSADDARYQTVYANAEGSVAAPTAGLHLDDALLGQLDVASVTLHVGPGTFLPMDVQDVRDHKVGAERVEISTACASAINRARAEQRPIVAVGTTVTRCLEGIFARHADVVAGTDAVDLVITPGFRFGVINGLLTNFHLPKSSLLMLTCAFGGRERILAAYRHAVQSSFRFYSYGDCMLIAP